MRVSPCAGQSACASITTSTLIAGVHTVEADYSSDVNFLSSVGFLPGGQTVSKASSSTALVSSSNPSKSGQPVTFSATVSAVAPATGTPTGTVTFKDGATTLGTGILNASAVATFSTSGLSVGSHSITATYGGNGNLSPSTSPAITQSVGMGSSATALTSSLSPTLWDSR